MWKAPWFFEYPLKLYYSLLNRIVQVNIAIDHEEAWSFGNKPFYGVAICKINKDKIQKVYFAR